MKTHAVLVADRTRPLTTMGPAVSSAAASGCERIAIDIDGLPDFDVPAVRQLIRLLRIAHDGGTNVALHVASADRRRALAEMGLDRVFAIVA